MVLGWAKRRRCTKLYSSGEKKRESSGRGGKGVESLWEVEDVITKKGGRTETGGELNEGRDKRAIREDVPSNRIGIKSFWSAVARRSKKGIRRGGGQSTTRGLSGPSRIP